MLCCAGFWVPVAQSQMWINEDDAANALAITQPSTVHTPPSVERLLECTREPQLVVALRLMTTPSSRSSQQWILKHRVKVLFKALETLDVGLKDYDALSWISSNGQQVIFINQVHRNAPPEALAALIAHEALHHDPVNSLQEEITTWTVEAKAWEELRQTKLKSTQLNNPLVQRLETLRLANAQQTLADLVRNNAGYQGLPEHSPGF